MADQKIIEYKKYTAGLEEDLKITKTFMFGQFSNIFKESPSIEDRFAALLYLIETTDQIQQIDLSQSNIFTYYKDDAKSDEAFTRFLEAVKKSPSKIVKMAFTRGTLNFAVSDKNMVTIASILANPQSSISHFKVHESKLTDENIKTLCIKLRGSKKPISLALENSSDITDLSLFRIADAVTNGVLFEEICIYRCATDKAGFIELFDALKHSKTLHSLIAVHNNGLDADAILMLASLLKNTKHLLSLRFNINLDTANANTRLDELNLNADLAFNYLCHTNNLDQDIILHNTTSQIKSIKDSGADEFFKSEGERVYTKVHDRNRDSQKNEVSFKSGNWYNKRVRLISLLGESIAINESLRMINLDKMLYSSSDASLVEHEKELFTLALNLSNIVHCLYRGPKLYDERFNDVKQANIDKLLNIFVNIETALASPKENLIAIILLKELVNPSHFKVLLDIFKDANIEELRQLTNLKKFNEICDETLKNASQTEIRMAAAPLIKLLPSKAFRQFISCPENLQLSHFALLSKDINNSITNVLAYGEAKPTLDEALQIINDVMEKTKTKVSNPKVNEKQMELQ